MLYFILAAIAAFGTFGVVSAVRDIYRHWDEVRQARGCWPLQMLSSFVIYFFGAFGVSDFTISTVVYTKTNWVEVRQLPGTLNTQPLVALTITALVYTSSIEIDLLTLLPFIILQTLGSYFGPRVSIRTPLSIIKFAMSASLLIAGLFILAGKLGLTEVGGAATGLHGFWLIMVWAFGFVTGFIKTLGIGSYPLIMAMVYILGLNPLVAYPLMMGASAISLPVAAHQFIKYNAYSRRITFCSMTAGAVAALIAVFVVKSLDVSVLQWIVLVVVLYAAVDMFFQAKRLRRQGE